MAKERVYQKKSKQSARKDPVFKTKEKNSKQFLEKILFSRLKKLCIERNQSRERGKIRHLKSKKKNERISQKLELMFMKHYAPNRCLYIKVAKLRAGVGSAEMSHLQNRCLKISG